MDFKKLYSFEKIRISKQLGHKKIQNDLSTKKSRNLPMDSGTFGMFTCPSQDFRTSTKYREISLLLLCLAYFKCHILFSEA